jgi:hypothetical protein
MRHDEFGELRPLRLGRGDARLGEPVVFVGRELIHLRDAVLHVDLLGEAGVRMVDAVMEGRILLRPDLERLHRHGGPAEVRVGLGEAGRIGGRARLMAVGIDAVDAGESAVFVVERAVLVEDHEDVFHLLAQAADEAVIVAVVVVAVVVAPAVIVAIDEEGPDFGARLGLGRHEVGRLGGGGADHGGLQQADGGDHGGRAAKERFHLKTPGLKLLAGPNEGNFITL